MRRREVALAFALSTTTFARADPVLSSAEIARAIALGRSCQAPILVLSKPGTEFDVYVETAVGRAALVVATAQMMHQSLDTDRVTHALQDGVRVWTDRRRDRLYSRVALTSLQIQTRGRVLRPVAERNVRLFLGSVASHGIIEPLRARFPEFLFTDLPSNDFEVVIHTTAGVERYPVTGQGRRAVIEVCNEPW